MPDKSLKIEELWICPPLAFARFGECDEPMVNYHWASNDYSARGTAETVIRPTTTFRISHNGDISAYLPTEIRFRNEGSWLPVAPFFELHGRLSDGSEGPLTEEILERCGLALSAINWRIHAANRKAFHYTAAPGDHVDAIVELRGDDHYRVPLDGVSPKGSVNPIIPKGEAIPLGEVQVIKPNADWPEIRLRITPPKGRIYAPTNTAERNLDALVPAQAKRKAFLAGIHLILNPQAKWATWVPEVTSQDPLEVDSRTNPGLLYAQEPENVPSKDDPDKVVHYRSLGFLDDSNDGKISVSLSGDSVADGVQTAYARFTCCPPDFQPDRRPFRSVADGLTDLTHREDVSDPKYTEGTRWLETEMEIADFMQRVRETMEASNLDHQNLRSQLANPIPIGSGELAEKPFKPEPPRPGHPLPLTELGRENHKRFLAYEVFKARMAQRPELFEKWIRNPAGEPESYDSQMPALMRGSDSNPMTITQRQYNLLQVWLERVSTRGDSDDNTPIA